jgi:hypothetical protein
MDFVPGQRLDELLCSGDELKSTVTESQLKKVYEQIATMYIQLWSLEFDQIGRLSWNEESMQWYVRPDPLTIKSSLLWYTRACTDQFTRKGPWSCGSGNSLSTLREEPS